MLNIMSDVETTLPKGFTARPATLEDVAAFVEIANLQQMTLTGHAGYTVQDTEAEWTSPGFDLANSTCLVFAEDGTMVGIAEVWDTSDNPVSPWVWSRVHPDYLGQGIGTYLLKWGEQRARQAIDRCQSGVQVTFAAGTLINHTEAIELLENNGLKHVRNFFTMLIDMDEKPAEPQISAGITIRPCNADNLEEMKNVYRAVDEAFADHYGHVDEDFEVGFPRFQHWYETDEENDLSMWYIAVDDESGEIAGVNLCRQQAHDNPEWGWVNILGVRRQWRKRGLGHVLLVTAFREFYERGKTSVGLGVDAENLTGALRLYKNAGMDVKYQFARYEKELRSGIDIRKR